MSERLTPEDVAAIEEACQESYRQCVADRRARIERVIAENPAAGPTELAEKANVSRQAIHNHKRAAPSAAGSVKGFTREKVLNPRDYQAEINGVADEAERHLKRVHTADTLEAAFELAGIADAFAGDARDIRRSAIAVGRDNKALESAEARAIAAADAALKAADAELAGSLAGQIGTALDNLAGLDEATTPLQLEGLCRLGEVCEAIIIFDGASDGEMAEPRIWLRRVEESDAKALAERIAKQYVPEDAMTDVWAHDGDGKPVQVLNLKPDQAA